MLNFFFIKIVSFIFGSLRPLYRRLHKKWTVELGVEFAICRLSNLFAVEMQICGLGQPSGRSSTRDLTPLGSPPGGRF